MSNKNAFLFRWVLPPLAGAAFIMTIVAPAQLIATALHDIADANRRQAAAKCIDSWHAWVRGSHTNLEHPDVEYCMLLSGVDPPAGLEDSMRLADLEREDADKRDRIRELEHAEEVEQWWRARENALLYFKHMCQGISHDDGYCEKYRQALADEFPP